MRRPTRRQRQTAFEATPLITPKRLCTELEEIFGDRSNRPPWVGSLTLLPAELADERVPFSRPVHLWVKGTLNVECQANVLVMGIIYELSRAGCSFSANSNHGNPARSYLKIVLPGATYDNMPAARFLVAAMPGQAVKTLWQPNNINPDNLYFISDPHAHKEARAVVIQHVQRLVAARHAAGTWSEHHTPAAYLANLGSLFQQLDEFEGRLSEATES